MALIEGDILVGKLYGLCDENEVLHINIGTLQGIVDRMPIEQDRPHGEWIRNDNGTYSCSVCHSWIPEEQHYYARYCLHCGRTMRKKEGDEK